jgi:flagellar hook-basal body complex protein FliE
MKVSGMDNMLAQMRAAIAAAQGGAAAGATDKSAAEAAGGTDFTAALKTALDGVAQAQNRAADAQKAFVLGDDKVSLSDVMIDMQKANLSFQTAVQVRNKVIAAYNDIMNMQV